MILPIGSMYTFTINLVVNAGKYTIHGSYGLWLMFTSKIALLGSLALQNHQARCSPFGCAAKGTARAKHAEAASNTTCTQHILPLAAYKAQSMSLTKLLIQAFFDECFLNSCVFFRFRNQFKRFQGYIFPLSQPWIKLYGSISLSRKWYMQMLQLLDFHPKSSQCLVSKWPKMANKQFLLPKLRHGSQSSRNTLGKKHKHPLWEVL